MTKKTINIIILVAFLLIVGVGVFLMFGKATAPTNTSGIVFYYGQECPHCLKVEEYIKNNNIDAKIPVTKKEVWHDQTNAAEMIARAKKCGLDPNAVGVPLLYDNGKCYIGDVDIINYFASKL